MPAYGNVISPQGAAVSSASRKKRPLYMDMIRGQYGQATQQKLLSDQINRSNREMELAEKQYKMQQKAQKRADTMGAIGLGIKGAQMGFEFGPSIVSAIKGLF